MDFVLCSDAMYIFFRDSGWSAIFMFAIDLNNFSAESTWKVDCRQFIVFASYVCVCADVSLRVIYVYTTGFLIFFPVFHCHFFGE